VDPITADPETVEWLAAHTQTDARQVRAELDVAFRRRVFVVDELLEAGVDGPALLDGTLRLTALSEADARELIADRRRIRSKPD